MQFTGDKEYDKDVNTFKVSELQLSFKTKDNILLISSHEVILICTQTTALL
jgi:hypothetical protein